MVKKITRFKRKEGDIILIKLSDITFGYGRVLNDPLFAFYDGGLKIEVQQRCVIE